MNISDRIRELRAQTSMTQKELSSAIGVSVKSLQCWEYGTKIPATPAVVDLAKVFNVSTDYLLGVSRANTSFSIARDERSLLEDYRALDEHGKSIVKTICSMERSRISEEKIVSFPFKPASSAQRYIPKYLTPSAAGSSVPLDGDEFEMMLVDECVPENADFAVTIQGSSMLPYIQDGDTVYVCRDCNLRVGDVGIFCVDGAMYCKQYYVDSHGNLTLVSANPEYRNTNVYVGAEFGSDVRCYGKVLLGQRIELPEYFRTE